MFGLQEQVSQVRGPVLKEEPLVNHGLTRSWMQPAIPDHGYVFKRVLLFFSDVRNHLTEHFLK